MTVNKYTKKPLEIEAVCITDPDIFPDLGAMGCPILYGNALEPEGLGTRDGRTDSGWYIDPGTGNIMIRTLEGDMRAPYGWWIIKGVGGEFYPCDPEVFEATYTKSDDIAIPVGPVATGVWCAECEYLEHPSDIAHGCCVGCGCPSETHSAVAVHLIDQTKEG